MTFRRTAALVATASVLTVALFTAVLAVFGVLSPKTIYVPSANGAAATSPAPVQYSAPTVSASPTAPAVPVAARPSVPPQPWITKPVHPGVTILYCAPSLQPLEIAIGTHQEGSVTYSLTEQTNAANQQLSVHLKISANGAVIPTAIVHTTGPYSDTPSGDDRELDLNISPNGSVDYNLTTVGYVYEAEYFYRISSVTLCEVPPLQK